MTVGRRRLDDRRRRQRQGWLVTSAPSQPALGERHAGDDDGAPHEQVPARPFPEGDHAEHHGDHRDEVGHGRRGGGAGFSDQGVVQEVGEAGVHGAEHDHRGHDPGGEVHGPGGHDGRHQSGDDGGGGDLAGGQRQRRERPAGEEPTGVHEAHPVAGRRPEAGELSPEGAERGARPPRRQDHHGPEEPGDEPDHPRHRGALVGQDGDGQGDREQRCRGVRDAGEARGDPLLTPGEQVEGQDVVAAEERKGNEGQERESWIAHL